MNVYSKELTRGLAAADAAAVNTDALSQARAELLGAVAQGQAPKVASFDPELAQAAAGFSPGTGVDLSWMWLVSSLLLGGILALWLLVPMSEEDAGADARSKAKVGIDAKVHAQKKWMLQRFVLKTPRTKSSVLPSPKARHSPQRVRAKPVVASAVVEATVAPNQEGRPASQDGLSVLEEARHLEKVRGALARRDHASAKSLLSQFQERFREPTLRREAEILEKKLKDLGN